MATGHWEIKHQRPEQARQTRNTRLKVRDEGRDPLNALAEEQVAVPVPAMAVHIKATPDHSEKDIDEHSMLKCLVLSSK